MVCGGISHGAKSELIVQADNLTAARYRDEVLRPVAFLFMQQRQSILRHDNAWLHVARVCSSFLANHNSAQLDRPPYSPGVPSNEHLCDTLTEGHGGAGIYLIPTTLAQLRNILLE